MNATTLMDEPPIRVRIPADLDTPDRLVAGLTARQLAVLAAVALPLYGLWQILGDAVPLPVLAAATAVVAAIAVSVAVGRRDGVGLDAWLIAAITHRLRPRRLAPLPEQGTPPLPPWAPAQAERESGPRPARLRLPADTIGQDGVIRTGAGTGVVLVAASTVTTGLHTPGEQAMLLGGYGRWLNSLTGRIQIVVSARRVDLGARALQVAETAHRLAHPALAAAAIDHAEHLLDLCEDGDPLARTVTIACTASTGATTPHPTRPQPLDRHLDRQRSVPAAAEAGRRASRTAAALAGLGSRCRVLDGPETSALLSAAVDPWGPGGPDWPRTPPGVPVTADRSLSAGREGARHQDDGGENAENDRAGADCGWADDERADRDEWSR